MRASTRIQSGLASALLVLLTLTAPAKAETDIVANGALNFFFPHGAVSIAIGEPLHRQYRHDDYRYETRRYTPKLRRHDNDYEQDGRYYKNAPIRYVVIEKPHRYHPVFIDHPRQRHHVRNHQNNERRYSKHSKNDYKNKSKRDKHNKREIKGSDNNYKNNYRH